MSAFLACPNCGADVFHNAPDAEEFLLFRVRADATCVRRRDGRDQDPVPCPAVLRCTGCGWYGPLRELAPSSGR